MRVAFATKDGVSVNDHFGWARDFLLYDVSADGTSKAGKITFDGGELDERGNDDKLSGKIDALAGCHIVYSEAIGGSAAARLTNRKILPMVARDERSITGILDMVKTALSGPTPPWLRKITQTSDPSRFDRFDEEDGD
ncbi:MAG: nitrogen fixation protein NifX [Nitrospinae bacterium]|nr:nitrogen fixation protein NifX [Nitrospinota bacterium]